jgi:NCS2 family nucleobase:cation symporter-2
MTVHSVDEVPPIGKLLSLGLQHVLAMYAGAVAVPLIVGSALKMSSADLAYLISADLLVCGVSTLIQCIGVWRFGIRLPLMQGCTFAAVTPMVLIGTTAGGLPAIYGAVIVSGLGMILLAPFFGRLIRFFPPIVTGTLITIIGLSLMPVAVNWAAGGQGSPSFGKPSNLAMALGVLVLILLIQKFGPGFTSRIAVLIGIVVGALVGIPLGFTDFSSVTKVGIFGISTPFHFGWPTFNVAAIVSMLVVMLVTITESTGGFLAVGQIAERPVNGKGVADGLRADGLSTLLGGIFNTFPYTAYSQNMGLLALTRVRSRYVVAAGGGILVVLGLIRPLGEVVAAIPSPVLGGAGVAMFGTVAAWGIRILARVEMTGINLILVAASLGVGLAPTVVPTLYQQFPTWFQVIAGSGISAGCVVAVLLNLLFNHLPGNAKAEADPEITGETSAVPSPVQPG